jgi:NDP-sugar pyrophosphorylase family protein
MILAAGLGTRLGALSDERPKPLLPVADVPLIRYAVSLLVGHGITEIVVNLHHRGELIERELGDGTALGARIVYSREAVILGTGGGLRRALPLLGDGQVVVVNGKILVELDLHDVLARHRAAHADATLVLRHDPEAARWGAVDAPIGGGPIRGFFGAGVHMFTGVHVLETALIARLPDDGQERCIVRQGYVPWIATGSAAVHAVEQRGYFMEHSTPERYLQGNINVLRGVARPTFPPAHLVGIDDAARVAAGVNVQPPVRVGPGAIVERGAHLGPDAVVGAGAIVRAGVTVTRSVVWPDADVREDARDSIVTPTQRVAVVLSGRPAGQ